MYINVYKALFHFIKNIFITFRPGNKIIDILEFLFLICLFIYHFLIYMLYFPLTSPIFDKLLIILSKIKFISSSVNVLLSEPNVKEYAKLFLSSAIPFPV